MARIRITAKIALLTLALVLAASSRGGERARPSADLVSAVSP